VVRRSLPFLASAAVFAFPAATASASAPPGATARCRDGTYSFSHHHSGTCSHHGGVAQWLDGTSGSPSTPRVGRTVLLAPRTRTSGCRPGPEPDRRCSPGAYYSGLTKAVICSGSFRTSSIRNVPQSEKFQDEREYGMKPGYYGHSMEIDHIVSLELGGSNDIANLFPEPGSGLANFHAKDRLENRLHDLVCAGQMRLRAVQESIARDWESLYRRVFGSSP
jgi:hypothetical protein